MHDTRTRSPTLTFLTPAPISSTVPTASWPRIRPSVTAGTSPFRMCRSVPQMVTASTRTMASVSASMVGFGTSSHALLPGPWYTSARIAASCAVDVCPRRRYEWRAGANRGEGPGSSCRFHPADSGLSALSEVEPKDDHEQMEIDRNGLEVLDRDECLR